MKRLLAVLMALAALSGADTMAASKGGKGGNEATPQTEGVVVFKDGCAKQNYVMRPDGTGRQVLPSADSFYLRDVSRRPNPVTVLASGRLDPDTNILHAITISEDESGNLVPGPPVPLSDEQPSPVTVDYHRFSPDGGRIAYVHSSYDSQTGTTQRKVYIGDVVREDGNVTGLKDITLVGDLSNIGHRADSDADWTFTGALDFGPPGEQGDRLVATIHDDLWVLELHPDGTLSASPLTRTTDFAERNPRWSPSPTADAIAFSGGPYTQGTLGYALYTSDQNIYTLDVSTFEVWQVTTKKNKGESGWSKNYPNWSPDGTYLLYSAEGKSAIGKRSSPCGHLVNFDLFQIPADGSQKAINVTDTSAGGVEARPTWGWSVQD